MLTGTSSVDEIKAHRVGLKAFELKNHLDNVLATVSDRKDKDGNAVLLFASDYYPFGMEMPGRSFNKNRFGFQGQEVDQEWLGGAVSFTYRVHDPRIGRFLSVDPLTRKYPHYSPYIFSGNKVIAFIELEGLEEALTEDKRVASSGRRPLTDPNTGQLQDDMKFGDMSDDDVDKMGMLFRIDGIHSDENLFRNFRMMATDIFSTGEMEGVISEMIDQFQSNQGGAFSSEILNKKAEEHPSTQRFITQIETGIMEALNEGVSPQEINLFLEGHPRFNTMKDTFFGGLRIAINDTQAYDVDLNSLFFTGENNFKAKFTITLYDHFGLDVEDAKDNQIGAGFRAWFRLQRARSYKPLLTIITIEHTFEGSFNTDKE